MNILSLFDGIGTGFLALKNAGIKIDNYYASEIEEKPIEIAKKNAPGIIELGDVNKIDTKTLEGIDLIIGGSPCQGFSRNGKHLNFDDPRSGLFLKYVEILEEIRKENKNVKFMLENVRMKKEWQNLITDFLEVTPVIIDSRVHTAQARERTYWTDIAEIQQPAKREATIAEIAESRDTSKFIKERGVWFDSAISERERVSQQSGHRNTNNTGYKARLYSCGRRRRNKPSISNKQNTEGESYKRQIADAGL